MNKNYLDTNKKSWNERTKIHYKSEFYDNDNFIKGKNSLNEIELDLFDDLKGKSVLHLQCHFGQDTISLQRLGAKATGMDLSDLAIEKAQNLAKITNQDTKFICCDVYDLPNHLDEKFDLVFTSYGTISWLPDMDKWAKIVSQFLKPNGKFIFVEFHPFVWIFDNDFENIKYSYFNSGAIEETEDGTYTNTDAKITQDYVNWNHSIEEVTNSLIKNGIEINSLKEYNYSPYNCFNKLEEFEPGKHQIKHFENKVPMVYSIVGTKK